MVPTCFIIFPLFEAPKLRCRTSSTESVRFLFAEDGLQGPMISDEGNVHPKVVTTWNTKKKQKKKHVFFQKHQKTGVERWWEDSEKAKVHLSNVERNAQVRPALQGCHKLPPPWSASKPWRKGLPRFKRIKLRLKQTRIKTSLNIILENWANDFWSNVRIKLRIVIRWYQMILNDQSFEKKIK